MSKKTEIFFLLLSDLIFINIAWILYFYIRVESGWILYVKAVSFDSAFLLPATAIYLYWVIIFTFTGLYQYWFARSRFDEFSSVVKSVSIGCLFLFFTVFLDDFLKSDATVVSRTLILIYWALTVVLVGSGRIIIRSIQRAMLQKGIGLRNTIIIGTDKKADELQEIIERYPQLGYKILGFIKVNKEEEVENFLGSIEDLPKIISAYNISEVLIALEQHEKEKVLDVVKYCSGKNVHLKIMPDVYEIVSGLAKTNQIYGVPLIEVMPEIMSPNARLFKRLIDIAIASFLILILSPFLLIAALLIKFTSEGGVLYKQTRVGRNGKLFEMYKFRSMFVNAEEYGPEWAGENDPRITRIGRIIRKIYFDEVPQLFNVLKNEMSIVGPRPERPYFVEKLKLEIPYYYKRLSVKPGITGWAQIKHKYDSSLEDVKTKLQYDFYYIENMSIKLDLKIMINTAIVVILMKGH